MSHAASSGGTGVASRLAALTAAAVLTVAVVASFAATAPAPTRAAGSMPTSVTLAGSLQMEVGCSGDWDPACAASHLGYSANSDVWEGSFVLPAGAWEYKAAIDDNWDVNYGLHAVENGYNIPLDLPSAASVKFYYDDKTHWATDNVGSVIATAAGSFQSELGCAGDWDPGCLRSWLEDPSGSGAYTFETTDLPAGAYETKVAVNEGWNENYGAGGVPNGANIPFTVPRTGDRVRFSWNPTTHLLSVAVDSPALSLTVTASPATYLSAGQSILYSFLVRNSGSVTLTGPIAISDDVLGAFACASATTLVPGATVTCARSYVIRPGDVNPGGTGSVTDHATASASYMDGPVVSGSAGTTIHQVLPKPTDTPTVVSFSPASGKVGAVVTISGTSFNYARSVTFNGVAASFSVRSGATIVATVPAGATTGPIRVTTPFGSGASRTSFYVLR